MGNKSGTNPFGPYRLWRWFHSALFFAMAVICGFVAGLEDDPKAAVDFSLTLAAVICGFVEMYYLALGRWQVSLAYLFLATTYLALTGGAAVTVFNVTRYLFAD